MSQPKHSAGPWRYDDFYYIWADSDEGPKPITEMDRKQGKVARVRGNEPDTQRHMDARLIVAAVNAFDSASRKLGIPAIELAERLQGGEIATLLEAFDEMSDRMKRLRDSLRQ